MKTLACDGSMLPNPRTVSNMIHSAGPGIQFENFLSLLAMQSGQFLVHDMIVTKVFTSKFAILYQYFSALSLFKNRCFF